MIIDIYTHIATRRFMALLDNQGYAVGLLGRLRAKQALYDLDFRFRDISRLIAQEKQVAEMAKVLGLRRLGWSITEAPSLRQSCQG